MAQWPILFSLPDARSSGYRAEPRAPRWLRFCEYPVMLVMLLNILPLLKAQEASRQPYSSIIPRTKVYQSPACGSMLSLKDGRILWVWGVAGNHPAPYPMQANFSSDGGRTWSDRQSLKQADGSDLVSFFSPSLARLKSGRIGLVHEQKASGFNGYNPEIVTTADVGVFMNTGT